jgi:hypothetical protein
VRAARIFAVACAVAAVVMLAVLVVLGAEIGWVIEYGGGSGFPPETQDVRGELPWMAVLAAGVLTGTFLAVKRPRHPIPWLLMALGLGFIAALTAGVAATYSTAHGTSTVWGPYVAWVGNWIWLVGHVGGIYLLLLFPDGSALSPRWRTVGRAGGVYLAIALVLVVVWPELEVAPHLDNPFGVEALRGQEAIFMLFILGVVLLQVLAIVCLVLRFFRSTGVERQQMKWMAFGVATLAITVVGNPLGLPRWVQTVPSALILAALVIAVTRYRLYDIDRVISRTVSYAVLTLSLAVVYAGGVVALGGIARAAGVSGGGDLVVAASTLLVAALFQPVRRRLQTAVDRRFNRARYDAIHTVERFAQGLRDEVDVDALAADVREAARHTLQPAHASIWLRGAEAQR